MSQFLRSCAPRRPSCWAALPGARRKTSSSLWAWGRCLCSSGGCPTPACPTLRPVCAASAQSLWPQTPQCSSSTRWRMLHMLIEGFVRLCVWVCACICPHVCACVHMHSQNLSWLCIAPLLCNGLCAPIWRNSIYIKEYSLFISFFFQALWQPVCSLVHKLIVFKSIGNCGFTWQRHQPNPKVWKQSCRRVKFCCWYCRFLDGWFGTNPNESVINN